ncbi:pfkB-like carbohydrate kinase family protein [Zea mays]|uniref:PfkB-like carbohydrate kinase family protein n=2 Tax=Zea mays TaxID=4577 RepID=A0A1D6JPP2_MAIZE|nr:pfkB-like carbohydrate kinase family protein [Zea mays]
MALQTLNPYRHAAAVSPVPSPVPHRGHPPPHAVLHLPPRRRLAGGAARPLAVAAAVSGAVNEARRRGVPQEGGEDGRKDTDLATLGNLCVDVVLSVPQLPPAQQEERKAYMERLAASPPDQKFWEAGGNCNLAFAAARLGLNCSTLGHVGEEIYGKFLLDVLQAEGISVVGMLENTNAAACRQAYETLLCWVLVDPFQKHGFCRLEKCFLEQIHIHCCFVCDASRADFSKEPAFSWIRKLPVDIRTAIHHSKILFCNGYAFDEFFPDVIASSIDCAICSGTAVFFDPGPRGKSLLHGNLDEQRALEHALRLSDVLLLTSDEAESLTNIRNPVQAGQELLKRGIRTKQVVIKMGSRGSIMITKNTISCAPAFKIDVVDTVGCGDSFTAAIAFGFLHDLPAVNTLTLANAVGAATATGCGAGRNVARLDKVLQLMREADLNEDITLWTELTEGNSLRIEVSILSGIARNGFSENIVAVPVTKVVSEVLPMFEAVPVRSAVQA